MNQLRISQLVTVVSILLFVLFLCSVGFAQQLVADANYGVTYNAEERVLDLPQDQGKWYVTLFGKGDRYDELVGWFDTHPGLKKLRSQVHFNTYEPGTTRYEERYAKAVPALPCVRVQKHNGTVVSEWYGEYLPLSDDALFEGIRTDLTNGEAECFITRLVRNRIQRRRRPCPLNPAPNTPPAPIVDVDVDTDGNRPDLDEPTLVEKVFPWGLAAIAAIGGFLAGIWTANRKEQTLDSPIPK